MPPPSNLAQLLNQLQYPAMTYVESRITEAWIKAHGAEYDSIDFNVRLGEGADVSPDLSEATRRMAALVTTKRADIIARRAKDVTILEVKVRISLPALGQLIGYRALWIQQYGEPGAVKLLAIGRDVVPDVAPIFRAQGIAIETFPRVGTAELSG